MFVGIWQSSGRMAFSIRSLKNETPSKMCNQAFKNSEMKNELSGREAQEAGLFA